jgi:hypothetical protein
MKKKRQNFETPKLKNYKKKNPWFGQVIKTCRHLMLNPFWDASQ